MAREEARVFTSIWRDEQFRAYTANAQRLFLFLLSQPDLTYCGTLALRERKWAGTAAGLTVAEVTGGLAELAASAAGNPSGNPSPNPSETPSPDPSANGALVVFDEDTEELLIRSLIRLDGVWKIPNLMLSARRSAALIESPKLRAVMLAELHRLPVTEGSSPHVRAEHALFIQDLGGPAAPAELVELSATRWTGSRKGNGKGSRKGSGNPSPKGRRGRGKGEGSGSNSPSRTPTGTSEAETPDLTNPLPDAPHPPEPIPGTSPAKVPTPAPTAAVAATTRLDIERLCKHLADRIEAHGVKRPTIGKGWRDAARLMLDRDGLTETQVHAAIDWAHDHHFWHRNILAMPKLRAQYDRLRLDAKAAKTNPNGGAPGNAAAYEQAMAHALAVEAAAATGTTTSAAHITIAGELE